MSARQAATPRSSWRIPLGRPDACMRLRSIPTLPCGPDALTAWPQVQVHERSGAVGTLPKADAVYVNAGVTQPTPSWLDALRPAGRLPFPLQPEQGFGGMLLMWKPQEGEAVWPARFVSRGPFINCQASQDEGIGRIGDGICGGGWQARGLFESTLSQTAPVDSGEMIGASQPARPADDPSRGQPRTGLEAKPVPSVSILNNTLAAVRNRPSAVRHNRPAAVRNRPSAVGRSRPAAGHRPPAAAYTPGRR
jgi:hypothetical protein